MRMSSPVATPFSTYEQIDQAIDNYLAARLASNTTEAIEILHSAEHIAHQMTLKTGDRFGEDIISYYRGIPSAAVEPLQEARKLRTEVQLMLAGSDYLAALRKLHRAKILFTDWSADIEVIATDGEMARYLDKTGRQIEAKRLMDRAVARTTITNHLFLKAQSLCFRALYFCDTSDFTSATADLQESIKIATPLDVPRFLQYPSMIITGIYHAGDDNTRAFQFGLKTLQSAYSDRTSSAVIQLYQLIGLSAFKLNYPALAETYLNQSIAMAEKHKNPGYLILSHSFLGIIKAEQLQHSQAAKHFEIAGQVLATIHHPSTRQSVEFIFRGYQARSEMLAGQATEAMASYKTAISIGKDIHIENKMALSQLHQGLGECMDSQGLKREAEVELMAAVELDQQAREKAAQSNSLLTFAASHKNCYEQLRLIRESH